MRVFDLTCDNNVAASPRLAFSKTVDELRRLRNKKAALEAERNRLTREAVLLDDAASVTAQKVGERGAEAISEMTGLLERGREATQAAAAVGEQIADLDREIWLLDKSYVGHSEVVLVATILAKRDCHVSFQLTYRTCPVVGFSVVALITVSRSGRRRQLAPDLRSACDHQRRPHVAGRVAALLRKHHAAHRGGLEQHSAHAQHRELPDPQEPCSPCSLLVETRTSAHPATYPFFAPTTRPREPPFCRPA